MKRPFSGDIFSIQGDSEGMVNILRGNSLGHCEKIIYTDMCLILNGFRVRERERGGGTERERAI
jgi:hypothetical protein